jgi:hypothetical protein
MTITSPRKSSTYPQDASCLRPSCTMPQSSHPAEDDKGKVSADEKAVSNVATRSATNEVDPEEERRLVRKLDTRILPIACLMYLFACEYLHLICVYNVLTLFFLRPCSDLDRSNLGNARLQGLPDDILDGDPSGKKFDWVNSIFFFSYVRVELCRSKSSLLISCLRLAPDPLSSSSHRNVEALPSSIVDGYYGNLLGIVFDTYGSSLPPHLPQSLVAQKILPTVHLVQFRIHIRCTRILRHLRSGLWPSHPPLLLYVPSLSSGFFFVFNAESPQLYGTRRKRWGCACVKSYLVQLGSC